MYLTIHRVRAHDGRSGFNGFVYRHGDQPIPVDFDLDAEAEFVNGPPVASVVAIPPGGNFVDSFLDVVGPDDFQELLSKVLIQASARLRAVGLDRKELREVFRIEPFRLRFQSSNRVPRDAHSEFVKMMELVPSLLSADVSQRPNLVILKEQLDDGVRYHLSPKSLEVIQAARLPFQHQAVTISTDVLEAYETYRGKFEDEVEALLVPSSEVSALFDGCTIKAK